jgi:hypothetical protein
MPTALEKVFKLWEEENGRHEARMKQINKGFRKAIKDLLAKVPTSIDRRIHKWIFRAYWYDDFPDPSWFDLNISDRLNQYQSRKDRDGLEFDLIDLKHAWEDQIEVTWEYLAEYNQLRVFLKPVVSEESQAMCSH